MSPPMICKLCLGMCQSKEFVIEGGDIRFITGIGEIITKEYHCAGDDIKCSAHDSRLGFFLCYSDILKLKD